MDIVSQLNFIDIVVLAYLLFGLIMGIKHGLSGEIARMVSLAVALCLSMYFYDVAGDFILKHTRLEEPAAHYLAIILLFFGGLLGMFLLRLLLKLILEFTFKGPIERLGGALAGLLRTSIMCSVALFFLGICPNDFIHRYVAEESLSGSFVNDVMINWYRDYEDEHPDMPRLTNYLPSSSTNHVDELPVEDRP